MPASINQIKKNRKTMDKLVEPIHGPPSSLLRRQLRRHPAAQRHRNSPSSRRCSRTAAPSRGAAAPVASCRHPHGRAPSGIGRGRVGVVAAGARDPAVTGSATVGAPPGRSVIVGGPPSHIHHHGGPTWLDLPPAGSAFWPDLALSSATPCAERRRGPTFPHCVESEGGREGRGEGIKGRGERQQRGRRVGGREERNRLRMERERKRAR